MSVSLSQSANMSTIDSTAGIRLVRVLGSTVNASAAFQQVRSGLFQSADTLCSMKRRKSTHPHHCLTHCMTAG